MSRLWNKLHDALESMAEAGTTMQHLGPSAEPHLAHARETAAALNHLAELGNQVHDTIHRVAWGIDGNDTHLRPDHGRTE